MARKSRGYVELMWNCPNCGTQNPGPQKTCHNCGMAQPDDVEFVQSTQADILQDDAKIAKAQAGADVHCYFCNTRNPAGATHCTQCSGALSQGEKRKSGQIMGAYAPQTDASITCSSCGTVNQATADKCITCGTILSQPSPQPKPTEQTSPSEEERQQTSPSGILTMVGLSGVIGVAFICLALFYFLFFQTSDLKGQVDSVKWEHTITIEAEKPVTRDEADWQDKVPTAMAVSECVDKVRQTVDEPPTTGDFKEVCGTPYTVDQGSGYGEVVEDCVYEVYDAWCSYSITEMEWTTVNQVAESGHDFKPIWPIVTLKQGEREGERTATYTIYFETADGNYTYTTSNQNRFKQLTLGSRWILKVNTLGGVNDVEPE